MKAVAHVRICWLSSSSPASPRYRYRSPITPRPVSRARRPSMVIDPPNGRVPLRPEAAAKRDTDLGAPSDSLLRYGPSERCITRGVPGAMFPGAYNHGHEIVQTANYVVIHSDMIHEYACHEGHHTLESLLRFGAIEGAR